jgi:UDP-glucose:(heptosyl)LPS alpha-1,3-glucosyltransferase
MIKQLNLHNHVRILTGRDDIPRFLLGADILMHPAYSENTGTVLLEAIASGLPVLASDVCGYAHYIVEAQAGALINSPFDQNIFNQQVVDVIHNVEQRHTWHKAGLAWTATADIFAMPQHAVSIIEKVITA